MASILHIAVCGDEAAAVSTVGIILYPVSFLGTALSTPGGRPAKK